jgi:GAF domain-containing protein
VSALVQDEHAHALIEDGGGDPTALAETLVALAERVAVAVDCSECCIYEYLPKHRALRAQAIWAQSLEQRDRDWIGQINHLTDLPGFDTVMASGSILVSYPEDDTDAAMRGAETMGYWGELASLYAPIVLDDEVVGILELTEKRTRREFSEADQRLVGQMTSIAAIALLNARRSREHEATNRRLGALLEASRSLTSTVDVDEVLALVAELAAKALDAPCSYIYEYDEELEALIWRGQYHRDGVSEAEEPFGTVYPLSDYAFDRNAIETNTPRQVSIDDADLDDQSRSNLIEFDETALLTVPLRYGSEIVGVLEVAEDVIPRHFSDNEIALASALGEQAAAAIPNPTLFRRLEDQNRHMKALLDSSRAIGSTVVLEEVLQRVGEQAAAALRTQSCYMYEFDAVSDSITWRSQFQVDPSSGYTDDLGTTYPLSDFPWDRAALQSGQVTHVSLSDAGIDPDLRSSMESWREQTLLTVPLMFGDKAVGLMELAETMAERRFTPQEIDLARAIGEQAAIAISNAQLYRRETWRNERLVRVLEISRAVGSSLEAAQVAEGLRAQVGRLFVDNPATVAVDLMPDAPVGGAPEYPLTADAFVAASLKRMAPLQTPAGDRHRLVVPLSHKSRAVGYIDIVGGGSGGFADDEIELVQLLANQAAASVDNARLYETIELQAITDGLTGLFNHRHFFERLRAEVIRARRYDFSLSVLMIDLDDFKTFNDRFGHPAGDRVLHTVADLMRGQLRQDVDLPARYGGEEFAVMLPHTPATGSCAAEGDDSDSVLKAERGGAWIVAERIRASIAGSDLPLRENGKAVRVTSSVGVATLPAHAVDADDLVSKADQALYIAKQLGKDRVELFCER